MYMLFSLPHCSSTPNFALKIQENFVVKLLSKYEFKIVIFNNYGAASSSNKCRNSDCSFMDS
jgi:hypothetical protein